MFKHPGPVVTILRPGKWGSDHLQAPPRLVILFLIRPCPLKIGLLQQLSSTIRPMMLVLPSPCAVPGSVPRLYNAGPGLIGAVATALVSALTAVRDVTPSNPKWTKIEFGEKMTMYSWQLAIRRFSSLFQASGTVGEDHLRFALAKSA